MGLTCYPVPGKEKSRLICRAFEAGAPRDATGTVFFGTEGVMSAFQKAKAGKHPWWYIDNSYFDKHRGIYFRVTKNALQVDPRGKTSTGERFARLQIEIKPWRSKTGPEILVCPQSDNFMKSTLGYPNDWAAETVAALKSYDLPHPIRVRPWNRDKIAAGISLLNDLKNLRLLVTHSSAAAITAMLEGVPAISMAGAAYYITGMLSRESVQTPPQPDGRLEFAQVLADNQFTLEEFRNGKAWQWLNK
jgi:hypothetical protein